MIYYLLTSLTLLNLLDLLIASTSQVPQVIAPAGTVLNVGRKIKTADGLDRFNNPLLDGGQVLLRADKRCPLSALEVVVGQPFDGLAQLGCGQLVDQQLTLVDGVQRLLGFARAGFVVNNLSTTVERINPVDFADNGVAAVSVIAEVKVKRRF